MEEKMAKDIKRAKFVRAAREERAWSQSQLAEIADVNLRTIQRLEKDGAASFETLRGVAQAFEIDVKDLNPNSIRTRKIEKSVPQKNVHFMPRLVSGKNLTDVVLGSDQFQLEHDDDNDPRSIGAMKDILNLLKGDIVRLYDADPVKRIDVELELTMELQGLELHGYYLFGVKRAIPKRDANDSAHVMMCTIFMSHIRSPKIIRDKRNNMLMPALLSEVA